MKKTIIAPKTSEKVRIEGVGTFNAAQLREEKARKADLMEHFAHLPEDQAKQHHETLWKAVSKGEMPEPETGEQI